MSERVEPVAYDPNRIPRRVGYLAMWTTVLWPMTIPAGLIATEILAIFAAIAALPTIALVFDLRRRAVAKGYHPAWGWLAPLGIIALLVIFTLPDRINNPPRGFEVTQSRSGEDEVK